MASARNQESPERELARLLVELAEATMPFGKYGPQDYPPDGVPIVDLPYEYLAWFARAGFPRGRLGELLQFVYQAKLDGADAMFDGARAAAELGRCTTGVDRLIPAVVYPGNQDQVVSIVRLAGEHGVPLYPISTGRNWGYGISPVTDGCIVLTCRG